MKRSLCLLLLALGSCSKVGPQGNTPSFPEITQRWAQPVSGGDTPKAFGDLLITNEVGPNYQKSLGEVAFNLQTQTVAWRRPEVFYGQESVVIGNALVYFNGDHQLVAIDQAGKDINRVELPEDVKVVDTLGHLLFDAVQISGDLLILPLEQAVLAYRIQDLLSGAAPVKPVWRYNVTPLAPNERAYFTSFSLDQQQGQYYVLEGKGSRTARRAQTDLIRLDAATGREQWRKTLDTREQTDSARGGVINAQNGTVLAQINGTITVTAYQNDGTERWKNPDIICPGGVTTILSHIVLHDDLAIISPFGDQCYTVLDLNTGAKRFVFSPPVGGSFGQIPAIVNGVMYATNGFLWAVDLKDGTVLGRSKTALDYAQGKTGTVIFDQPRNQLLVWAGKLNAFTPLR
ncbi:PQQ-binding-like beta-propeller repeat protein [Deinococcus aluminii]|uniref:Pyrrolo-quinoline quinone repeat domain-containing protein n=1 Tax=Deinococcus aluminii TaxID=1656885 RepID=A0ABP9XE55_9DEIO